MRNRIAFAAVLATFSHPSFAKEPRQGEPLSVTCHALAVEDACDIFVEASKMLSPSYEKPKSTATVAAFNALGYEATYLKASGGWFRNANDVFLVSRRASNRLYIVITGTESIGDGIQDLKFRPYTTTYNDGQFYIPPGHAGFRRGVLNIINSDILKIDEFDSAPLDCMAPNQESHLSKHLCKYEVQKGSGPVETIVVGHSLGAGIGLLGATAFAGLEVKRPDRDGPVTVAPQRYWPLRLHAIVAFAPPYSVYTKSDFERGLPLPAGAESHWAILDRFRIPELTMLFINDRDIVPGLSVGYGRHFGIRFRIEGNGAVTYDGTNWGKDVNSIEGHGSFGYCSDVLKSLDRLPQC